MDFLRADYLAIRAALERLGSEITVVSSRVGPVTSDAKQELNLVAQEVEATVAFGNIRPSDFDAIVFIPSSNSEFLYASNASPNAQQAAQQTTYRVLTELREANVCLAAIGNAVFVLARYRALDNHEASGAEWITARTELAAVKWDVSRRVVASGPDGQFVTAHSTQVAASFAEQVHASAQKRVPQR